MRASSSSTDMDAPSCAAASQPGRPAGGTTHTTRFPAWFFLTSTGRAATAIVARGNVHAASPYFQIATRATIYGMLLRNGIRFDQVQRDGRKVVRVRLDRRRAHLHDRHAHVYAWPNFAPGSDAITDHDLNRLRGRTVDVARGWYDAAAYLKFTHSSAWANDILLFSQRSLGGRASRALRAEARHGLNWLRKMWDSRTQTLYIQVGVGSGNRDGTFHGDHDLW